MENKRYMLKYLHIDELFHKKIVYPLLLAASLFLLWEYVVLYLGISVFVLPPPSLLISDFVSFFDHFIEASRVSLGYIIGGYLIGTFFGMLLGILMYISNFVERSLYPILILMFIIPKIILAPIIVLWFGAGTLYFLSIPILLVFFPMIENTLAGLQGVPREMTDLHRIYRSSHIFSYWHVMLPYSLPYIGVGLKIGVRQAVVGVIVAEFVVPEQGLGYYLILGAQVGQPTLTWNAILLISVIGIILYKFVEVLERRVIFWREE